MAEPEENVVEVAEEVEPLQPRNGSPEPVVRSLEADETPALPTDAPPEDILGFFEAYSGRDGFDRQSDAALLFAYHLQKRDGMSDLQVSDLIRCCIRAGVDTRNFNRTLGALTRRGLLETVRSGHAYRLSEQGVAAVEERLN